MKSMIKTQIYLNETEYEAVRGLSYKERMSISKIIRRLIDENLLTPAKKKKSGAAWLLSIAGTLHDTKTDVSEKHDDYAWGMES